MITSGQLDQLQEKNTENYLNKFDHDLTWSQLSRDDQADFFLKKLSITELKKKHYGKKINNQGSPGNFRNKPRSS